jgi:hypothetical protein
MPSGASPPVANCTTSPFLTASGAPTSAPEEITAGSDEALWFAEFDCKQVGRIVGHSARRSHTSSRQRGRMMAAAVAEQGLAS